MDTHTHKQVHTDVHMEMLYTNKEMQESTLILRSVLAHVEMHVWPHAHTHTNSIPMINSVTCSLSVSAFDRLAHKRTSVVFVCACEWEHVCADTHYIPPDEKPLLLYVSGFVRAVCLAMLPWWQNPAGNLQGFSASITAVYDGTDQRGGGYRKKDRKVRHSFHLQPLIVAPF